MEKKNNRCLSVVFTERSFDIYVEIYQPFRAQVIKDGAIFMAVTFSHFLDGIIDNLVRSSDSDSPNLFTK